MMQVVNSETVAISAPKTDRTAYLARLLNLRPSLETSSLAADTKVWLQSLRDRAAAVVHEQSIPSTKEEDWRFTDLSTLLQVQFAQPEQFSVKFDSDWNTVPEASQQQLIFINGVCGHSGSGIAERSDLDGLAEQPSGLFLGSLAAAMRHPVLASKIQEQLALQPGAEEVFTALNTASFTDVAVVWVPKNLIVADPVRVLWISTATEERPQVAYPRCLVIAETGSSLTFIEEYRSRGETPVLINAVTELWVQDNAQINHTRIQYEHPSTFHLGKTAIAQARDARYTCNAITFGARLSRHNLAVYANGEQTETHLNGLTRIAGEQLADTHSTITHTRPYGISRQIHKCIIDDRAHAVFNGKICVPQAAQLTDAAQLSRNLLLSSKARVDTKPQLEIVADNVKCAHGATVSQLEGDEIFYLQSRGLDRDAACQLLVHAFAVDILNRIPVASVRDRLTQQLAHQDHDHLSGEKGGQG
jgi:Fe-S cluster assembly protein SufD